ncbi:hypothetical protein GCM10023333_39890 [Ferrimonas pelagia]|uniref:MSHA biogenesis protein MshP n=2 Tax=Ferrimonas pelagia TaxID=1177826 RepID=A0ABP9FJB1_9GAMM
MYLNARAVRRQRGSALILAVFILTVMMLLSLALLRVLNQETTNVGLEINATRAWSAAQSGIDFGLARVLNRSDEASDEARDACDAVSTRAGALALAPGEGLANHTGFYGCTVALACTYRAAAADDDAEHRFAIEADATCGAQAIAARRVIEVLAYD